MNRKFQQMATDNGADPTTNLTIDDIEVGDTLMLLDDDKEFSEVTVDSIEEDILNHIIVLDDGFRVEQMDLYDGDGVPAAGLYALA
jgi:hypothetical protein